MPTYGYLKQTNQAFEAVLEKLPDLLQKEGFGILTRIDLDKKLKEKLGVDFRRYTILGVCNPPNAYKALQAEESIGLLLPCNLVVYEKDGATVVGTIRPTVTMQIVGNPGLDEVARLIETKLVSVVESV